MKKFALVIAAVYTLAAFAVPCRASYEISAQSAVVIETDTLSVLYEKNLSEPMQMASTTKIMTALVVLEECSLDEKVEIKPEYSGIEGSSIYLKAGEMLSVEALLYGLMLESGNDAAVALACHTAESIEEFSKMMNRRAAEIGCTDTNFVNPHGLDAEGHYSTAYDLALIMAEAMENEDFCRIASTKDVTIEGRKFSNHNKLLWQYEGCIGGKTGYTKSSGRSLVSCAERNGMRLVCVTLNDSDDWKDHTKLFDNCFSGWKKITVDRVSNGYLVPVIAGEEKCVHVYPKEDSMFLLPADAETDIQINVKKFLYAPVEKGSRAGNVTVTVDGKTVFSTPLVADKTIDIDANQLVSFGERLNRAFFNTLERGFAKLGYEPEG